jgi:hypothetical protein
VWGFFDIYMWKGIWDGLNCVAGMNFEEAWAALIVGTGILVATKSYRFGERPSSR